MGCCKFTINLSYHALFFEVSLKLPFGPLLSKIPRVQYIKTVLLFSDYCILISYIRHTRFDLQCNPRLFTYSELSASFRSLGVAATTVPNGPFLSFFEEKVSLSKDEISKTSSSVNNIVSQILDEIRKIDMKFALKILHSGNILFNL